MPDFVLSTQNRFYAELEPDYGRLPAVGAGNRLSAVQLGIRQRRENPQRRDKTGSRTFSGVVGGGRRRTEFELLTYLVSSSSPGNPTAVGPLVQSALGAAPVKFNGGSASGGSNANQIVFGSAHGLRKGQAICYEGEIRFVESVISTTAVGLNAPLRTTPGAGRAIGAATTYFPADQLPSAAIFDYWDPQNSIQRCLCGASVDRFAVRVNADFHELNFSGEAQDCLDSISFLPGQGGVSAFPAEPAITGPTPAPVPGNLGQVWLGSPATKYFTLTSGQIEVQNDMDFRRREFGSTVPLAIAPGVRRAVAEFEIYETDDEATRALYAAAREERPVSVMFQLGQKEGQLLGVYLPKVVPEVPEFEDEDRVLRWRFRDARAQGTWNDEIMVAFG